MIGTATPMSASRLAISGTARGSIVVVDGDAHQLASGPRQFGHLEGRPGGVGRVRVRHRLHDDRMGGPDGYAANQCSRGFSAGDYGQWCLRVLNLKANSLAREQCMDRTCRFPSLEL